jgi:hypothetical protein
MRKATRDVAVVVMQLLAGASIGICIAGGLVWLLIRWMIDQMDLSGAETLQRDDIVRLDLATWLGWLPIALAALFGAVIGCSVATRARRPTRQML